jgi:hypothetical protein
VITPGNNWPVLDNAALGTSLSGDATKFSHIGRNVAITIPDTNIKFRWYGESSRHTRIVHFESPVEGPFRTNVGTFAGIETSFTALAGHTGAFTCCSKYF